MDFGDILKDWEKNGEKKPKNKKETVRKSVKSEHPMESLLKQYAPDQEVVGSKKEDKPQINKVSREKMRRRKADSVLDLHGMTTEEARIALNRFIRRSYSTGARKILIIHGKGNHTKGEAVLKPLVRSILEMSPYIGDTGTPERRDGGSGATWAVVRQRSL
ncbi:Smr/MutS family protein [Spirochaeta isovalerica]|uniref:DNA-nicking Smr family endonuclease n=1 Tax=Spirochaeta isovalerica TaxID=150 RepID=A0A841R951_9SPIO|nr:Smr/MutS family protein [Spirochaeta isovalerica]MBB6479479.1 DNA-nicking Smr family endonuclease [Spirochaeta isovalerica]